MDAVRDSVIAFMESSPLEGDALTKPYVQQEKSDELRIQTEALQSEHKRVTCLVERALEEWQKFDKKQNAFSDWLKAIKKQFEELRDGSSETDKEGELKVIGCYVATKSWICMNWSVNGWMGKVIG